MKQFTPAVLTVWLAAWAIVILQPCCESVLASGQTHHHSHGDEIDHSNHQSSNSNQHPPGHDCRIAIEDIDDLSSPISGEFQAKNENQYDDVPLDLGENQDVPVNITSNQIYHYFHPPPGNNKLYLSTLRLRV